MTGPRPEAGPEIDAGLASAAARPLSEALGAPVPAARFLALAIPVAWAVARMHRDGVIHRDLKPANVLVDPDAGWARVIGFDLAIHAPLEPAAVRAAGRIEGTLAYMAPEQTGRVNRPVDHRADLYALGAVFYELLAGAPPCRPAPGPTQAEDAAAVIHCHLARRPDPPAERVPGLPAPLSDLVLRLLAKAPEDRYQAAAGVAADLERCRDELARTGTIAAFPLGERDVPERFNLPRRLVGRGPEQAKLLAAFDAVAGDGRPRAVWLGGAPGVGKSSLVEELRLPIVQRRGHLAAGKFAGPGPDVPFAALGRALRDLTAQVLAEPEARVAAWRADVLAVLPGTARLVMDLVPELEALLGPQPEAPPLPPGEARNRFALTVRRFLGAVARPDRPLVLFLDDLQWSDPADHALIADLLTDPEMRHVLVIGAYRDDELGPDDPFWAHADRVRGAGVPTEALALGPLAVEHLATLLADAVRAAATEVTALASLVHEKTAGNPLFARRLLAELHDEGLIAFAPEAGAWRWDLPRIRGRAIADNVAEMLIAQLRRLPAADREALGLAACLGQGATLAEVLALAGERAVAAGPALEAAGRRGLVVPVGPAIAFAHDRIREAALALIPERTCREANLALGRRLAAAAGPELEVRLFEAARRVNAGAPLIADPAERARAADLDLRAGRRAKAAAAFDAAHEYLQAGWAFLGADPWAGDPAAAIAFRLELAEVAGLRGRFDDAERALDDVRARVPAGRDRVAAERIAVELRIRRGDLPGAIAAVHAGLAAGSQAVPPRPTPGDVAAEIGRALAALGGRDDAAVLALPPLADPDVEATMALLVTALPAAYFTDVAFHDFLGVRLATLSLEHGLAGPSAVGLALLGMALGVHQGRHADGERFARLAIDLAERRGADAYLGKVLTIAAAFVSFWTHPFAREHALYERARWAALEAGDVAYRCYVASQQTSLLLVTGAPLGEVRAQGGRLAAEGRRAGFEAMAPIEDVAMHFVATLVGEPSAFAGPPAMTLPWTHAFDHILRLQARYLLDDAEGALAEAAAAEPLLWSMAAQKHLVSYHLYRALAQARRLDDPAAGDRDARLADVRAEAARLRGWAATCPANFAARHALVAAELARHEGRDLEAMRGYEHAAREAAAQADPALEGLARSLASRHFAALGLAGPAASATADAARAWRRWGATALVARLDAAAAGPGASGHQAMVSLPAAYLDVMAVVKASHALAGEIVLDRLAETLMTIMLEQAGADRGWLLRPRGDDLEVVAAAEAGAGPAIAVRLQPRDVDPPRAIVDLVRRTRRPLAVDDPARDGRFAADPYFAAHGPRAALALPLVRQGQLAGLLYLENALAPGAFPDDKLAVLELLAAQAAISLENARVYEAEAERARLETREAAARAELAAARELDAAKDAFIGAVSHDLRSPLTGILGYVELLQEGLGGPVTTEQARFLAQILAAGGRLVAIVDDLLDVARMRAGAFTLRPEPMDLAARAREVMAGFEPELRAAGVVLEDDLAARLTGTWDARLGRVVANLIGNAVKFTPRGGRIRVHAAVAGDRARVEVSDTGPGIAAEDVARLFRPFSQLGAGARKGGTGLGLSIVKAIVEAHGGEVGVASTPGAGSTFWFEVPCAAPPEA